jgi:DivIVA domain-containing protein
VLTPEEIRDRRFLVTVPGYDLDEVHTFLEQVAAHVEDGPSVPRAERYADIAAAAKQVLEAADAAAAELRAHGERDADRMESEALARAAAITREAEESVQAQLDEARQVLAQAEAKQRDADRKLAELARERKAFEREQQAALATIRRAGGEVKEVLRGAEQPREALLSAIEQVRGLLDDGFAVATQDVDATYEETRVLAHELERALGLDPDQPGPRSEPASENEGPAERASENEGPAERASDPDGASAAQVQDEPHDTSEAQDETDGGGEASDRDDEAVAGGAEDPPQVPDVRRDPAAPPEDDEAFYSALASRIRETTGGTSR